MTLTMLPCDAPRTNQVRGFPILDLNKWDGSTDFKDKQSIEAIIKAMDAEDLHLAHEVSVFCWHVMGRKLYSAHPFLAALNSRGATYETCLTVLKDMLGVWYAPLKRVLFFFPDGESIRAGDNNNYTIAFALHA